MTKRKADSLAAAGRSTKRSKSNRDETLQDWTQGPSIRQQAEPYRLVTARFPLNALTSAWSVGSNRHLDSKQVDMLCQIFEKQRLQREPEENRLRIACSRADVQRITEHLNQAAEQPLDSSSSWPFFRDWMSINGCPAEIMAGQHRVEALKVFLTRKSRPLTSPDDDPHWWLCDVYDRDELPPKLSFLLRANRLDHTLPDNHGQVWMQISTLAQQDSTLFKGSSKQVEDEMEAIANLAGRDEFPTPRMVTLWKNRSWKAMITRWCSTALGRSTFNISLWADLARCRIDDFWFDRLEIILQQISKLCTDSPESIQPSDWTALVRLPKPHSPTDVHKLFFPRAPFDVLAKPEDYGSADRPDKFLVALNQTQYLAAYRFVMNDPNEKFLNLETVMRGSRTEGMAISSVMSHVVQWINPVPTQVSHRENNKPQLWRDFVPALQARWGSETEEKSRLLQRQIFDVVRGRIDDLKGSLDGKVNQESYLDRFSSPIWHELLVTVRTAGPQFQGTLASFNPDVPDSHACQPAPALPQDLSRAICRLSQISRNPALKAAPAIEQLMKRISPIVMEWASQQCEQALEDQALRKAPAWPPSVLNFVRTEHQSFRELVRASPRVESEKTVACSTPPRSVLSESEEPGLGENVGLQLDLVSNIAEDLNLTLDMPSRVETYPACIPSSASSILDEMKTNVRHKAVRKEPKRRPAAEVSSRGSWKPALTTMERVAQEGLNSPVKSSKPPWMKRPPARSNRDLSMNA